LHNLSFPYDHRSVNSNIPVESKQVSYQSITHAIKLIQSFKPPVFLAKSDIADAFKLVPLHPSQYHLTGFYWEGYYFDKTLPQGCSSSCNIFEQFSSSLKWILKTKLQVPHTVKVLDDFLFVANSQPQCQKYLSSFIALCERIGVPLSPHKTVPPTTVLTFLGIELDTKSMTARLPRDKLLNYSTNIDQLLTKNKITLRDLKSLIGKLHFATAVVKPGRAFLRRMHDLTIGIKTPHHFVRLTSQVKKYLSIWQSFLKNYNGITIIKKQITADSGFLHLYSDASKTGFGATYGSHWIEGTWPPLWRALDIMVLELYPIFLIISSFAQKLQNSTIMFHCDNEPIVTILNKQTSKHPVVMHIVRPFVLLLLQNNIHFTAKHISGVNNILCDAISRQQVTPSLLNAFGMKYHPTPIPSHLLPENYSLPHTTS